jgi:hypothetical protein
LERERGLLPRKQHLLPPLSNNIKCGNSLIGYDMFDLLNVPALEKGGKGGFDDDTKSCINPFDWSSKTTGFGEIMENGGFDAVIGNPPYVRQEMLGEFKDYFQRHYEVYQGTADLYAYFIEKGVSLLRTGGLFSYIVANKWMRASYGKSLRRWMKKQRIEEIIDFGDLPVFETATTYPCILRIRRGGPLWPPKSGEQQTKTGQPRGIAPTFYATDVKALNFQSLQDYIKENRYEVSASSLSDKGWSLVDKQSQNLLDKLRGAGIPLGEYVKGEIYRGVTTGLNEAFVINSETKKLLTKEDPKSAELIKPFLLGRDIKRYELPDSNKYLIFTRRGIDIKKYPAIQNHLLSFKDRLMPKPKDWKGENWKGRKPGFYKWYEIQDTTDYYSEFAKQKIMLPDISLRGNFTFDTEGYYCVNTAYIICNADKYLLGILNSQLINFMYEGMSSTYRGGYLRFIQQYLEKLPIRTIDFNNPSEKASHDKLVSLVDKMLELHKKKTSLPPSAEREKIEREIAITDEKIDEIVYGLYGVTEAERKIIEG